MGNRKVMDMKQGSLGMNMGEGEIGIRVPVWGYMECNNSKVWRRKYNGMGLHGLEWSRNAYKS